MMRENSLCIALLVLVFSLTACQRSSEIHSVDDASLVNAIRNDFAANHDAKGATAQVEIHAKDGVVTLSGKVDTVSDKALAENIARRTKGVTSVINQIVIAEPTAAPFNEQAVREQALRSGEKIGPDAEDARIYDDVRRQIVAHEGTSKREIFVDVVNRNVKLRGRFVGTSAARDEAIAAARAVKGVNAVNNQLVVSAVK